MTETDDIKELVEIKFPNQYVDLVECDEVGGSHSTYLISFDSGGEVVVKVSESDLSHLPDAEESFELDAEILEFLGGKTSLPVP